MSQTEVQLIKADSVVTADIANSAVTDAKISALTSSKLTGALPAISGAALTGITSAGRAHNLVINGAMKVAQRGTSSTSQGYQTVDRWRIDQDSGLTEACTQSQVALSSSDTPYASGFRYAFRITNGNQTSQDANDYIQLVQKIEAQDLAQSGWNYTSDSSNITLSFWVKASIAQTFYVKIEATDASRTYTFPIAVTTSWQKLTKTIPGNSNLVFNNDTGVGMRICIIPYYGTNYTTSGHTINTWIASDGANQTPDFATTWFSGNDATFDVTGVQLEVGDSATDFEHRSFAEEIINCERYFQTSFEAGQAPTNGIAKCIYNTGRPYASSYISGFGCDYRTEMRATPSVTFYTSDNGNSSTANTASGYNGSGWSAYSVNTQTSSNTKKLTFDGNWHSGIVLYQFNYKADAEL